MLNRFKQCAQMGGKYFEINIIVLHGEIWMGEFENKVVRQGWNSLNN
jgi:hypothetical protein